MATNDNLQNVSPPKSPEEDTKQAPAQQGPEYRADIGKGPWKAPPSKWRVNDSIFLQLNGGRTAGPFSIVACRAPQDQYGKWRYDIRDSSGNTKTNISGSSFY